MPKLLIIDDESDILSSLSRILRLEDYQTETAESGEEGLHTVEKEDFDLVMLDIKMPRLDGLQVLKTIKEKQPDLPVIIMSGHGSIETAVESVKLGAFDFIEKPISSEKILPLIENALNMSRLRQENLQLKEQILKDTLMVGESKVMQRIRAKIAKVAPTDGRVFITGENGSGKELVARAIHQQSLRAHSHFVKVNCAAIPDELIESELFGHEKGSFTGAFSSKRGKFEIADGSTLLLDEIGDMSLRMQAKMLTVLQEGEFERVGGNKTIKVDVRVLSATNKNIFDEIAHGNFRKDLYYRLNVIPFEVAALRERKEDIPILVEHFLSKICHDNNKRLMQVQEDALKLLIAYDWPGNIRELKNIIERLVILAESEVVTTREVQSVLNIPEQYRPFGIDSPLDQISSAGFEADSYREAMLQLEKNLLLKHLISNHWNVAQTARQLKLERSHLYKKMRALGIDKDH